MPPKGATPWVGRGLAAVSPEVHDTMSAGVGNRLRERFERTHQIERIDAVERTEDDFPNAAWWSALAPGRLRRRLLAEHRPPGMYRYFMQPR